MAEIADSIRQELQRAHPWPSSHNSEATVAFSRRLCPELALKFAEALRLTFPSIQPDPLNRRAKLYQRAPRRLHRLAVSFCAPEEALGLGISIKSLFLRDVRTGRFKVKLRRLDDLLRAEADDYHRRQPHAVLVGAVFIPEYAALDEGDGYFGPSSFAKLVRHLRARAGRKDTRDEEGLFERLFIALYSERDENLGDCAFFDVMEAPPRVGRPAEEKLLTFRQAIAAIIETYDQRNQPPFLWAGEQEPPAPGDSGR